MNSPLETFHETNRLGTGEARNFLNFFRKIYLLSFSRDSILMMSKRKRRIKENQAPLDFQISLSLKHSHSHSPSPTPTPTHFEKDNMKNFKVILSLAFLLGLLSQTADSMTYSNYTNFASYVFPCNDLAWQVANTNFYSVTINPAGNAVFTSIYSGSALSLNAIGFSVKEQLIYAVDPNAGDIYKINSNGDLWKMSRCMIYGTSTMVDLTNYFEGDVDPSGIFWIAGNELVALDLLTDPTACSVIYTDTRTYFQVIGYDMAFSPTSLNLYSSFSSQNSIYVQVVEMNPYLVQPKTYSKNTLPIPAGQLSSSQEYYATDCPQSSSYSLFVSDFFHNVNDFYSFDTGTQSFYRMNVTNKNAISCTLAFAASGPQVSSGDGASCPFGFAVDLSFNNSSPAINEPIKGTLVINNYFFSSSNNVSVSLPLPAGISVPSGAVIMVTSAGGATVDTNASISNSTIFFPSISFPPYSMISLSFPLVGTSIGNFSLQSNTTNIPAIFGSYQLSSDPSTTFGSGPTNITVFGADLIVTQSSSNLKNEVSFVNFTTNSSTPLTPVEKNFTLYNYGNQALNIYSISASSNFSIIGSIPNSIAVGGSTALQVEFQPSVVDNSDTIGNLTIISNDPFSPTFIVGLRGSTPAPKISVSFNGSEVQNASTIIQEPSTNINSGSNVTITIANNGSVALNLGALNLTGSGAFSIESAPQISIPAGGSTTVVVGFNSSIAGSYNATLNIPSNDPAIPLFVVPLSGLVTAPQLQVSFSSNGTVINQNGTIIFPLAQPGSSSIVNVSIDNTGNSDLQISSISLPPGFSVVGGNISANNITIPPNSSGFISISENTAVEGASFSGQLSIVSNSVSPVFNATIEGTVATISVIVTYLNGTNFLLNNFASYLIGSVFRGDAISGVVQITNNGTGALNLSSPTYPQGFTSNTTFSATGTILAPGESIYMLVSAATSGQSGLMNGTYSFVTNDPLKPLLSFTLQVAVFFWTFTNPSPTRQTSYLMYTNSRIEWTANLGQHSATFELLSSTKAVVLSRLAFTSNGISGSTLFIPHGIRPATYYLRCTLSSLIPQISQYSGTQYISSPFKIGVH